MRSGSAHRFASDPEPKTNNRSRSWHAVSFKLEAAGSAAR